jgi:hypothetical protein
VSSAMHIWFRKRREMSRIAEPPLAFKIESVAEFSLLFSSCVSLLSQWLEAGGPLLLLATI